jgi:hypothetical protein
MTAFSIDASQVRDVMDGTSEEVWRIGTILNIFCFFAVSKTHEKKVRSLSKGLFCYINGLNLWSVNIITSLPLSDLPTLAKMIIILRCMWYHGLTVSILRTGTALGACV